MEYIEARKYIIELFEKNNETYLNRDYIKNSLIEKFEIQSNDELITNKRAFKKKIFNRMFLENILSLTEAGGVIFYYRIDCAFKYFNGYKVIIKRENSEISFNEWMSFIQKDHQMDNIGFVNFLDPQKRKHEIKSPGICEWIGYSKYTEENCMAIFEYVEGSIIVKSPDTEILIKMYNVAKKLNAFVQGESGEKYNRFGDEINNTTSNKPGWKFW